MKRRDQRTTKPPKRPRKPSERDVAIVHAVYTYRILRTDQIRTLFFKAKSTGNQVLRRLFEAEYVERILQYPQAPFVSPVFYILGRKGVELLRIYEGIEDFRWYASNKDKKQDYLEHSGQVNDVWITVKLAAPSHNVELVKWIGESQLKADYDFVRISGVARPVSLIPDSYFVLKTHRGIAHFFVELDTGKSSSKHFKAKVLAYQEYYRSGAYTRRYGAKTMRVLTVVPSEKRLETLKKAAEAADPHKQFGNQFWFTTRDSLSPDTVLNEPIWQVATREGQWPLIS